MKLDLGTLALNVKMNNHHDIKIPTYLRLNHSSLVALGLLEAEMTKNDTNVTFVNSEPIIIDHILRWFGKTFNIPIENWKWFIQYNTASETQLNYSELKARECASLLFWIRNTGIKKEKRFPKWITYCRPYEQNIKNETKYGTLHINYGNYVIQSTIFNVLKEIPKILTCSDIPKRRTISYLDGLFCGDGGANFTGDVRRIFIAFENLEEKDNVISLLNSLDIDSYLSGNEIFVSNLKDLYLLYKYNLFSLHPEKKTKLLEMLNSYKQFQGKSKNIEKSFLKEKQFIEKEIDKTKNLIRNRLEDFNNLFDLCKDSLKHIKKFPTEVKLTGLSRKPKRFDVASLICENYGITTKELMNKTGFTYASIKHVIQRLYKERYIDINYTRVFIPIKIFPTSKLLDEIQQAKVSREIFESRYEIPKSVENEI